MLKACQRTCVCAHTCGCVLTLVGVCSCLCVLTLVGVCSRLWPKRAMSVRERTPVRVVWALCVCVACLGVGCSVCGVSLCTDVFCCEHFHLWPCQAFRAAGFLWVQSPL